MIPPNINKENVLAAIKRIDSEGIHADRHLTVYVSSNDEMPHSRPKYRIETLSGRAYWVLTPGR
jgi:hypothetical protein